MNKPNIITTVRIICSLLLFPVKPLGILYIFLYILCGASDVMDGYIARNTHSTTRFGTIYDSIADIIFAAATLITLLPKLSLPFWCIAWIITIAAIRFFNIYIGFQKFHTLAFLHTYMNKITGFLLFCFPVLYLIFGISRTALLLCTAATISSLEELLILHTSKRLNPNIKSFFKKK